VQTKALGRGSVFAALADIFAALVVLAPSPDSTALRKILPIFIEPAGDLLGRRLAVG
jgi:hypothetical protein